MRPLTCLPLLSLAASLAIIPACKRGAADNAPKPEAASPQSSAPQTQAPPAAPATLDGKTFAGEAIEHGKPTGDKDEITFANGRMHSKGCDQYGFGEAPYTATASGDAIGFTSTTTSPKEGAIAWSGTVTGDALSGTMVWTKQGQAPITYDIKGTLRK